MDVLHRKLNQKEYRKLDLDDLFNDIFDYICNNVNPEEEVIKHFIQRINNINICRTDLTPTMLSILTDMKSCTYELFCHVTNKIIMND